MKWWLKIIMVFLAMGILYISFVRASLEKVINDERFDSLRKISVSYVTPKGENKCYRLPESGVLPDNIFYSIKEFRDNLWIYLTRDKADKIMLMVLINDKRLEEVLSLEKDGVKNEIIRNQLDKTKIMLDKINLMRKDLSESKSENDILNLKIETVNDFYHFVYEKFYQGGIIDKCYE